VVTFFVCRGQPLDALINATYYERVFYETAKVKFFEEETAKYKAIFGEGEK
jgi:hypothetical protein